MASLTNRANLDYRQLYIYVIYYYLQIFRKFKEKELLTRLIVNIDKTMLRDFANLVNRLDFKLLEIIVLKQYLKSTIARARFERSKSLIVINSVDKIKKQKYKLLRVENYVKNDEFLFVNYLHKKKKKQDKEIFFFFFWKFVYFVFFERLLFLILNSISRVSNNIDENINRSQDAHIPQERRELELELDRLELQRQKQEQQEQEQQRQEQEQQRQEQQRQEQQRQEREQQR